MAFGPEYIGGLVTAFNRQFPWRISKVEGGGAWVALRLSSDTGWLLLSWEAGASGCCIADEASVAALKKRASARTPMTEAIKSRLVKGEVLSVRQINRDRVLEFEVRRFVAAGLSVNYFLVVEATEPVGNLILLDENRRIEELARHCSPDRNLYRTLLPGYFYQPPPAFEGLKVEDIATLTYDDVSNICGIGRPLARLIQAHWEELTPESWLKSLKCIATEENISCQRTSGGYITRFPVLFTETEPLGNDSAAAAAHGVLRPLLANSRTRLFKELDTRLNRVVKGRERHLDGLFKQRKNNAEADVLRRKGELLLSCLSQVKPRAELITLTDWQGESMEIALDPKLSASKNAERYFKKYRKALTDPEKLEQEIIKLQSGIKELQEQKDLLETISDPDLLSQAVHEVEDWLSSLEKTAVPSGKKQKSEKNLPSHQRFEMDGFTILVGLSARGNRYVTFKQAVGDDLWLHAHELPGAHVIIKGAADREALETTHRPVLEFAASLAAEHSKGKNALSVQVDYTERRYVRSVPGTEALVTYINPGTIRVSNRGI